MNSPTMWTCTNRITATDMMTREPVERECGYTVEVAYPPDLPANRDRHLAVCTPLSVTSENGEGPSSEPRTLRFHGVVTLGDSYRVQDDEDHGAVLIGGRDVVDEIEAANFAGEKINVGIGDETFDGDLFVETGYGYSEYTPVDPDELKVGDHDLIEILGRHEGNTITLWVSNGPINLLEDGAPGDG